jgi:hypothetical protein
MAEIYRQRIAALYESLQNEDRYPYGSGRLALISMLEIAV